MGNEIPATEDHKNGDEPRATEDEATRRFHEGQNHKIGTQGWFEDAVHKYATFQQLRDTKGQPLNTSDQYLLLQAFQIPVKILDAGIPGRSALEAAFVREEGERFTLSYTGSEPFRDRFIEIRAADYEPYKYLGTNWDQSGNNDNAKWKQIDWDSHAMFKPTSTPYVYEMGTNKTDMVDGGMYPIPISTYAAMSIGSSDGKLRRSDESIGKVQFFNLSAEWKRDPFPPLA